MKKKEYFCDAACLEKSVAEGMGMGDYIHAILKKQFFQQTSYFRVIGKTRHCFFWLIYKYIFALIYLTVELVKMQTYSILCLFQAENFALNLLFFSFFFKKTD